MTPRLAEADKVRFTGSVPRPELAKEIREFKDQWNLYEKDVAKILGVPFHTLHSILISEEGVAYKRTVDKIRAGIENYDPRTCRYRRIHKTEARKAFQRIKDKHGWTWPQVCEATKYPHHKLMQILSDKTNQQTVCIEVVRNALINYQDYLKRRAETLERESRHKIA